MWVTGVQTCALPISNAVALGLSVDVSGRTRVDSLTDAVSLAGDYGGRACDLMAKATGALLSMRGSIYPEEENAPTTFSQLVDVFCAEEDPLGEYSREQTLCGAETVLTLAMGHEVQGDFDKVTSEFPKGPDGKEVDLLPLHPRAWTLAEQLSQMMEHRAAKTCQRAAPFAPSC